jgi:hypothetical protein
MDSPEATAMCSQELASQLRQLAADDRSVDVAAIALYGAVKTVRELRWIDLAERSREDYRHGVRVVLDVAAHLIGDVA